MRFKAESADRAGAHTGARAGTGSYNTRDDRAGPNRDNGLVSFTFSDHQSSF